MPRSLQVPGRSLEVTDRTGLSLLYRDRAWCEWVSLGGQRTSKGPSQLPLSVYLTCPAAVPFHDKIDATWIHTSWWPLRCHGSLRSGIIGWRRVGCVMTVVDLPYLQNTSDCHVAIEWNVWKGSTKAEHILDNSSHAGLDRTRPSHDLQGHNYDLIRPHRHSLTSWSG